jgi:hypothetical protein
MWHSQCRQIRQGLTLDGSNPEDEALPAAYVGELQRLAAQRCSEMPRGRLTRRRPPGVATIPLEF